MTSRQVITFIKYALDELGANTVGERVMLGAVVITACVGTTMYFMSVFEMFF